MTPVGAAASGPAPEAAAPTAPASATGQWEEVLLLETLRYLRISPPQLAQLQPSARTAADRLAQERARSERTGSHLEPLAQQSRDALRQGQRPSSAKKAEA